MYIKTDKQDLIRQFEQKGKDSFRRAIEKLEKNGVCRLTFPYANEITVNHLQEIEPKMDSILRDCETLTILMERLWDILKPIPGINQNVVNDYALIYSYIHDFDNDADCESLISNDGKAALLDTGTSIEEIRGEIKKMGKNTFSKKALAFFINHLSDI